MVKVPVVQALLDEKDVAAALRLSLSSVRQLRQRGSGPAFVRVGDRSVRYHPDDLIAYIEGRRKTSTAA